MDLGCCTFQRLLNEIPVAIKKIKEVRNAVAKKDEDLYLRRTELSLKKINQNIQDLMNNEYASFYHKNCKSVEMNME